MTSLPSPILQRPIDEIFEIRARILEELHRCSIHRIGELATFREADLLTSTQLNLEDVLELKEALANRGIALGWGDCQ